MVDLKKLVNHVNDFLDVYRWSDYCPNGLQVEGRPSVSHLVSGVTASQALIEYAIDCHADALLVHHGYFWKSESPVICGMKKKRLGLLLGHDMSLLAYHLPLDAHPVVGNNAQLGRLLGLSVERSLEPWNKSCVAVKGRLSQPLSVKEFADLVEDKLQRRPFFEGDANARIETVAWCTGAAQHYVDTAAAQGVDAFLTGEVSEQSIHTARETGIVFFAAGHHATERYGVQALGGYLQERYGISHTFIDVDNPV